jgi:S-formylglutathione hydrolase FrmB
MRRGNGFIAALLVGALLAGLAASAGASSPSGLISAAPECVARTTPVPGGPAKLISDTVLPGYGGRLHHLVLSAPALYGDANVNVLLPPKYASQPRTRFHTLYLLHGSGGLYSDWVELGDAPALIAEAYRADHLPQVITVMPEGGSEGYYTDWYGKDIDQPSEGPPQGWATWDIDELIPYIDSHYRTIASRDGRAVAGLSMGGFGATSLPARHPDMFSVAGSFSGADDIDLNYPEENLIVYGTTPAFTGAAPDLCIWGNPFTQRVIWEAVDPAYLAPNLSTVHLFLASGNGTPGSLDDTSTPGGLATAEAAGAIESNIRSQDLGFAAALDAAHIPYTYWYYGDGTHSWPYWQRDLAHFFPFLVAGWKHPKPVPAGWSFRSEAGSFEIWGWNFKTSRAVDEFTYLAGVSRHGLTVTGSGRLTVKTAALYPAGSRWLLSAGGRRATVIASRGGRLSFDVDLGPSQTAGQTAFPLGNVTPAGLVSAKVSITRVR